MEITGIEAAVILTLVSSAVLLIRLWSQGLIRQYPYLSFLASALAIQSLILLPAKSQVTYANLYYISTPILWILYYGVVLELYRLVLEDYPGISSAGRKAVTWSMGAAVLLSIVWGSLTINSDAQKSAAGTHELWKFRIFYSVEQSVMFGLLLFLILIQLFLFRYRLRLSRNRLIYSTGYALFFGLTVASDIILPALLRFGAHISIPFTIAVGITGSLIFLAGGILITREGEVRSPVPDISDNTPERLRLQQQLIEMNQMLSKVARRS